MSNTKRRATAGEIEDRRQEVLRLRFAGMTETAIAVRLGVSPATVSRDLDFIHEDWAERLGPAFDARAEVAEAIALYALLETKLVSELLRLEAVQGSTAAKVKCTSAVLALRSARVDLLGGVGLLGATLSTTRLPSAAEIRTMLKAVRAEKPELISEAEKEGLRHAGRSDFSGSSLP